MGKKKEIIVLFEKVINFDKKSIKQSIRMLQNLEKKIPKGAKHSIEERWEYPWDNPANGKRLLSGYDFKVWRKETSTEYKERLIREKEAEKIHKARMEEKKKKELMEAYEKAYW